MPRTDDPYSRVYWRAIDDPKFAEVWFDDHALAWWLRLLIAADQAFPASAVLPAGVHRGGLKTLTEAGLVDVSKGRYRIRGLDAERARRSRAGKAGAEARWHEEAMPEDHRTESERDADASPDAIPTHPVRNARQEEPRKDKKSREERGARPSANGRDQTAVRIEDAMHWATHLHFPVHSRNGDRLMALVERHGIDRVEETIREAADDMGIPADSAPLVNTVANYLQAPLPPKRSTTDEVEAEARRKVAAVKRDETARLVEQRQSVKEPDEDERRAGMAQLAAAVGKPSRGG